MKTKALLLAVLFGSALAVSAQNAQRYEPQVGFSTERGSKTNFKKNKATDNVFISLAGGANVLFGDLNGNAELMDRIAPSGAISVGKWYNPYLAFRLQVNGGKMRNYSYVTDYKSDNAQEFWWINPHLDLMWDVTNFFAPYKESKVFRFIPFVGLGYALRPGYTDDKTHTSFPRAESASLNGGAQFMFRLSKRVDLFLEGQYTLLGEHWNWDSHPRPRYDRAVQAMLGLNFNLGRKEFEVIEPMDYNLLNDLNDQINRLREENAELAKRPSSPRPRRNAPSAPCPAPPDRPSGRESPPRSSPSCRPCSAGQSLRAAADGRKAASPAPRPFDMQNLDSWNRSPRAAPSNRCSSSFFYWIIIRAAKIGAPCTSFSHRVHCIIQSTDDSWADCIVQ